MEGSHLSPLMLTGPALPHSPLPSLTTSIPQCSKWPSSLVSIQMGTMMGNTIFSTSDKVAPPSGFSPTKNGHFLYGGSKLNHTHLGGVLGAPQASWAHLGFSIQAG